jgi:hypothetical protein
MLHDHRYLWTHFGGSAFKVHNLKFFLFFIHILKVGSLSILANPGYRLDFLNKYKTVFFLSLIFVIRSQISSVLTFHTFDTVCFLNLHRCTVLRVYTVLQLIQDRRSHVSFVAITASYSSIHVLCDQDCTRATRRGPRAVCGRTRTDYGRTGEIDGRERETQGRERVGTGTQYTVQLLTNVLKLEAHLELMRFDCEGSKENLP